jgi:hypothetical protein
MNLINQSEAEKAAREYAEEKTKIFFISPNSSNKNTVKTIYKEASEAANDKFQTDYLPVILKCREALECELSWLETYPNPSNNAIDRMHDIKECLSQLKDLEL